MPRDELKTEGPVSNATISAIKTFILAQSRDQLAKITGFFHLAEGRMANAVDFKVDAAGEITLTLIVRGLQEAPD